MERNSSLMMLLITILLTFGSHCSQWQGTGSGMNSTVLAEIWDNLGSKLATAAAASNQDIGFKAFVKDLSDRLNTRWNPAWNVALTLTYYPTSDTILYGYAFRDQWMWFNALPQVSLGGRIASLVVWKDYNCQTWKYIADGDSASSAFSAFQKMLIETEIGKITENDLLNDVWRVAYTMMTNLQKTGEFSSGYSMILAQGTTHRFHGYVCRVGDNFYFKQLVASMAMGESTGTFYMFQTR